MEVFPDFSMLLQAARMLEENKPPMNANIRTIDPAPPRVSAAYYDGETDEEGHTVPSRANRYEPYKRPLDAHNEVEKKRRAYLSECYTQLRDVLPGIAGTKASNVTVLRTAAAQVAALQEEERALLHAHAEQMRLRAVLTGMAAPPAAATTAAPAAAFSYAEPAAQFEAPGAAESDGDDFEVPDTLSRRATPEPDTELPFSVTELPPDSPVKHHAVHALSPGRATSKLMMLAGAINEPAPQTKSGRRVRLSAKALSTF